LILGSWDILPNGDRIWRIQIISRGAKSLNFIFNTYQVPTGATVYLYNDDRTDLLGAYTNVFNRPDEMLGTWMVEGENVWIEYYEPKQVAGEGKLNISRVVHGYRSVTDTETLEKALNDSGDCNQDVNCPIGDDFDEIKDQLKKAVGFIVLNGFVCSGTLINNANNDRAPYFLTANHCDVTPFSTWAFRFNWISPNPSCATTISSADAGEVQTTSGATLLASNSESDFRLLRLDGGLDESWDLAWAGWDISGEIPNFVVGIHHPSGDIMKVCRENQPPIRSIINFNGNATTEMWRIEDWDLGVTERGSSGSALFDPDGRIIGQLSGGQAACNGTDDNDQFDVYGRFDVSWNFGTTDTTRLSNWLDPENTGISTLNILSKGDVIIRDDGITEDIILYPNPTEGIMQIAGGEEGLIYTYSVFDVFGKGVRNGQIQQSEQMDLSSLSSGVYFIKLQNFVRNIGKTIKIVVQ